MLCLVMANRMRRLSWATALVTIAGCSEALDEDADLNHAQYSERLEAVGVDQTLLGHEWLDAAHAALTEPTPVTLPYAESGAFVGYEATALGLAFSAVAGQKLRVEVTQPEPQSEGTPVGRIYADVFRIEEIRDQVRYIWVGVLPLGESQLQIELPRDATYVVRVQPELLTVPAIAWRSSSMQCCPSRSAGFTATQSAAFSAPNVTRAPVITKAWISSRRARRRCSPCRTAARRRA